MSRALHSSQKEGHCAAITSIIRMGADIGVHQLVVHFGL